MKASCRLQQASVRICKALLMQCAAGMHAHLQALPTQVAAGTHTELQGCAHVVCSRHACGPARLCSCAGWMAMLSWPLAEYKPAGSFAGRVPSCLFLSRLSRPLASFEEPQSLPEGAGHGEEALKMVT